MNELEDEILFLAGDGDGENEKKAQKPSTIEPTTISHTVPQEEKRPARTPQKRKKPIMSPRRGGYSEEDGEVLERSRESDGFGLYQDDDDRDRLENLKEFDRERILAERAERKQHNLDLEAVQLLFNPDDVSSTRRSSRTKVPKKKGKDLEELKRRRAQKGRRAKAGSQSPEPGEHMSSGEEGQVDEDDEIGGKNVQDPDEITVDDIRSIQLNRHQFSDWMFTPFFEETVVGCFVRLHIGQQEGKQVYRVCEIEGVEISEKPPYKVEKCETNKMLRLKHADARRVWPMSVISNSAFAQHEFDRWLITMKTQKLELPSKETALKKKEQIKYANEYILSEVDVENMVKQKKSLRGVETINLLTEKTTLVTQKNLATAQGNFEEAQLYATRIQEIDRIMAGTSRSPKKDTWARVNERNRLKNLEDSREAEKLARNKKKEFFPIKSLKSSVGDSPTRKEFTGQERTYIFEKARKLPMTPYEALIKSVQANINLPRDPEYERNRERIEAEYDAKYAVFSVEQSLMMLRKIQQLTPAQQQSDVPQKPQKLPPREESKNPQHYASQSSHSTRNPEGPLPLKDLHYEI